MRVCNVCWVLDRRKSILSNLVQSNIILTVALIKKEHGRLNGEKELYASATKIDRKISELYSP